MIVRGGFGYTIIQNEKNEVYVCGNNHSGQLGLGDNENRNIFEKVNFEFGDIKNTACYGSHIVIHNKKNEIYMSGDNYSGQLGLGDNIHRNKFEKVEYDFGKIRNIVCGGHHTVIQNEKNEIYVCGDNFYGQLGLSDDKRGNKFEKVEYDFGEIKNIACGSYHTVIQDEKNAVYVCGYNGRGQLGFGDEKDRNTFEKVKQNFGEIKNIACGIFHTVIQNEKNEIYVCGFNGYGQLGLGGYKNRDKFKKAKYDFGKIKKIACGGHYTIIQNEKNEIYVCGRNMEGQLGLGDYKNRDKFKKLEHDLGEIKNIACGMYHMIIQNEKNEIYACGSNHYGQLGLGDKIDRKKFEKIDADNISEKIYNLELKLNMEKLEL